ncbi:hypothetical protein [Acidocella sp.]|jgi:hypothetical protein
MKGWRNIFTPAFFPVSYIKESGRFLKKAAQKFLRRWAMGVVTDNAHGPD